MSKVEKTAGMADLSVEDYQKLVENLRIRINVLNASIFLLEDKLQKSDSDTYSYINKINSELEVIRKMVISNPTSLHTRN